jgi:hypothetical protein
LGLVVSYDRWKLSNPQDDGWTSDEVTSCCGVEERVKENLCDDRQIYYCSECGEDNHWYELIEKWEYDERRRDDAQEYNKDE